VREYQRGSNLYVPAARHLLLECAASFRLGSMKTGIKVRCFPFYFQFIAHF